MCHPSWTVDNPAGITEITHSALEIKPFPPVFLLFFFFFGLEDFEISYLVPTLQLTAHGCKSAQPRAASVPAGPGVPEFA